MPIGTDLFDRITDRLVEHLREDDSLGDGLPGTVEVYKGYPRPAGNESAVWVHRAAIPESLYTQGMDQVDMTGRWNVVCLTRLPGDNERLEQLASRLAANVWRCICENKLDRGYWITATPRASAAVVRRDQKQQLLELETIGVEVEFEADIV